MTHTNPDIQTMFSNALSLMLKETFEEVRGVYLDKNTSIFETLATISAQQASQPLSDNCVTIAAHVAHMTFYIEILLQLINGKNPQPDWKAIWNTVSTVTPTEWEASQAALRDAYQRVLTEATTTQWQDERQLAGAMGLVAHNAYHLGEIRQALCHIND